MFVMPVYGALYAHGGGKLAWVLAAGSSLPSLLTAFSVLVSGFRTVSVSLTQR
jgi:hypothetical protein